MNRIESEVRGPGLFNPIARLEYRALQPGVVLVLEREPGNAADPHAIIAKTTLGQPCGYIARQQAKLVAPEMDAGVLWVCKVLQPARAMQYPKVLLFKKPARARR